MNRVRRRLLLYSAPVALIAVIAVVKLLSVVVLGNSAAASFADRDTQSLAGEVAGLQTLNIVERGKADFAAGTLAVLQDRLEDADRHFSSAMSRLDTDESCSARVNLELVRETLGDRAVAEADPELALAHYLAAREVVERASGRCFADNPAPERLNRKIGAASAIVRPPAASVPPVVRPPPPVAAGAPTTQPPNRLDPTAGDPLDRLQQILRDAATG